MSGGGSHLDRLVAAALAGAAEREARVPLAEVRARARDQAPPRSFSAALLTARASGAALIAEVKRASPSRGAIAPGLDPARMARAFAAGGAACLSVLTDGPHFGGSLEDLVAARGAVPLPVLRKDFLVSAYQLVEARAHGADAALLIAAALEPARLADLRALGRELGLCILLEIHEEAELEAAASAAPDLLGINARDLKTLVVDGGTFARLAPRARAACAAPLVAESGVKTAADVRALAAAGAAAMLVGEALSGAADPEAATAALCCALPGAKA